MAPSRTDKQRPTHGDKYLPGAKTPSVPAEAPALPNLTGKVGKTRKKLSKNPKGVANAKTRKGREKAAKGTGYLQEIDLLHWGTEFIPFAPFARLCREITSKVTTNSLRFQKSAVNVLLFMAVAELSAFFTDVNLAAIRAKRVTIQ